MLNSKVQYDDAVRIATEFKREKDAEIGDWFNEPKLIRLHEYKCKTSPRAEEASEEASDIEDAIDWEEVLGSEGALAREEYKKDFEEERKEERRYFEYLRDKNFGADALLDEWIPRSENHRFWWDVLEAVAAYALRKREVPDVLADWLADKLEGKMPPNKGAHYYAGRDFMLATMVGTVLANVDVRPTRNKGSSARSACDAVGEVVRLSYESIEAAWYEYGLDPFLKRSIRAYGGIP